MTEIIWVDLKIIPKSLKHFAKRINTDFIDYGGVEQGPNAEIRNGESKFPDYWISSILNISYQFSPAILIDKKEKPKNIDNDFFHLVGVEQVPEDRISCCDLYFRYFIPGYPKE